MDCSLSQNRRVRFLLFASCLLLLGCGHSHRVGIHSRRWRIVTFPPLRRVTFCQTRQKVTKKRCAPIIRPLRYAPGFPRYGLAPGRTALQAPSWGPALDGHPCPSPPFASPALGLLKSQSASPELSRAYKQNQNQKQKQKQKQIKKQRYCANARPNPPGTPLLSVSCHGPFGLNDQLQPLSNR